MKASRCRARSSRTGARCKRRPILGAVVCATHGGSAPQVRRSAQERLLGLVDPALGTLARLIRRGRPDGVALDAARDALDRAGYARPARVELSGSIGLGGLRAKLNMMGAERSSRLAELLQREALGLDDGERAELVALQREAGLTEEG